MKACAAVLDRREARRDRSSGGWEPRTDVDRRTNDDRSRGRVRTLCAKRENSSPRSPLPPRFLRVEKRAIDAALAVSHSLFRNWFDSARILTRRKRGGRRD